MPEQDHEIRGGGSSRALDKRGGGGLVSQKYFSRPSGLSFDPPPCIASKSGSDMMQRQVSTSFPSMYQGKSLFQSLSAEDNVYLEQVAPLQTVMLLWKEKVSF